MNFEELIGTELGGCRIISLLGSGGMGAVFKAEHLALERIVAVKVLSQELASNELFIQRFLREAKSIARLDHPNIVQVYDIKHEKGLYFIIMQYVEGRSLDELVEDEGRLSFLRATRIIAGVARGLEEAHSKGVIHRDIKPANILISRDDLPKLVDFGLARQLDVDQSLTMAGEIFGSAHYLSPEQAMGRQAEYLSDLYSLGATYYYALTGRPPFEGITVMDIIFKHVNENPPPLRKLVPSLSQEAEDMVMKLLSKRPSDRPSSAREVYLRLHGLLSQEKERILECVGVAPEKVKPKEKRRLYPQLIRNIISWLFILFSGGVFYTLGRMSRSFVEEKNPFLRKIFSPFYTLDQDFIWRVGLLGFGILGYLLALIINKREFRRSAHPSLAGGFLMVSLFFIYLSALFVKGDFISFSGPNYLVFGGIAFFIAILLIYLRRKVAFHKRVLLMLVLLVLFLFYSFGSFKEGDNWLIQPFKNLTEGNTQYLLLFALAIASGSLSVIIGIGSENSFISSCLLAGAVGFIYLFSALSSRIGNWREMIFLPFDGFGSKFLEDGSFMLIAAGSIALSVSLLYKRYRIKGYFY